MRLRFNELSAQLVRLNHGLVTNSAEPANSGFEPDVGVPLETAPGPANATVKSAAKSAVGVLAGWRLEPSETGANTSTIAIDGERRASAVKEA